MQNWLRFKLFPVINVNQNKLLLLSCYIIIEVNVYVMHSFWRAGNVILEQHRLLLARLGVIIIISVC